MTSPAYGVLVSLGAPKSVINHKDNTTQQVVYLLVFLACFLLGSRAYRWLLLLPKTEPEIEKKVLTVAG